MTERNTNLWGILFPAVLALFVASPLLSSRLDPNGYAGGRSRDVQERAIRNSSAVATMLGEFRTAMSDIMYIKTERYLDNGVAYMPHLKKELLSVSGTTKEIDAHQQEVAETKAGTHKADAEDFAGTATMIPTAETDFRGPIGMLERAVKPWRDPALGHNHSDGTELLPWYRLMTLSDPHYVLGYTVGGWWLKSRNLEAATAFAQEGIKNNPDSFQIHFTLGQLYFEKARLIAGAEQPQNPTPEALDYIKKAHDCYVTAAELALRQRPPDAESNPDNPAWGHYLEDDALASCRLAVLSDWQYGSHSNAVALAKHYLETFHHDASLERISQLAEP